MFKKRLNVISVLALTVLAACTPTADVDTTVDVDVDGQASSRSVPFLQDDSSSSEDDGVELEASSASRAAVTPPASSTATTPSSTVRTIQINVENWAFNPTTITAKKGEKVQLQLVGDSGIHGFAVPGLGKNVRVEAGKTVTITLPTDTAGSFEARCSIPCGSGHKDMTATILITE